MRVVEKRKPSQATERLSNAEGVDGVTGGEQKLTLYDLVTGTHVETAKTPAKLADVWRGRRNGKRVNPLT